ncbi:iron-siderophore ABC transporter substrate-binding protein [Chlorogloeopsis sp. ULAP01]|uniref:ABC transporter substrate-binding protein n=1 Tax=Chlorogloeopsis sp. ULAP01 TaxID=3056483 RepID=UPI0025AA62FB|nr:iron-siderophore ABC transporter substrate-binding protein [Chlorogloeopsis sp. ULAP01]MDM9382401.1 iron-siderophore ABC transporter substrate-binding protein [Chlorogloeopsis sp. ULAP01]
MRLRLWGLERWLKLFFLVVITCGLVYGCNNKFSQLAVSSSSFITSECKTIKYAMGESCVPLNPQRVVVLDDVVLANAIALGVEPVGAVFDYTASGIEIPVFLQGKIDIDKFPSKLQSIGTQEQPSIEKIMLAKPDLILGFDYSSNYDTLSQIAPTILIPFDQAGSWEKHLLLIAEVLNKAQVAKKLLADYNQRIQKFKTAMGSKLENFQVSLAYLWGEGSSLITSDLKNSFSGSILEDFGLSRPPKQDIAPEHEYQIGISEEMINWIDGDVLFLFSNGDDNANRILKKLQQSPLWKQLKVVQQNHTYIVDHNTWRSRNILAANRVIDDLFKSLIQQ